MEIKTLKGVAETTILNTFNHAFSDYFVTFKLTQEQLHSKLIADKVNLEVSVGVFEDGHLIAFILHALEHIGSKKVVYNAGTGVVPDKRGQGLTKQMYQFILPILKVQEVDDLLLEVISENVQAITSYEKSGYTKVRDLPCYKGTVMPLEVNDAIQLKTLETYDWQVMTSFWDTTPTWQNAQHVVDSLKADNIYLGAHINKQLVGYVIFNPKTKRLQQLAVDKAYRKRKVASTLIQQLITEHGTELSAINVDSRSKALIAFIETIGLKQFLSQIEMKLELKK